MQKLFNNAGKVIGSFILMTLLLTLVAQKFWPEVHDLRTFTQSDNITVATAVNVTSTSITFSQDLFQADLTQITSLTSDNGLDAPVAVGLNETSRLLAVSGLHGNDTRHLIIVYHAETNDQGMRLLGPFIVLLVIIGIMFICWKAPWDKVRRWNNG